MSVPANIDSIWWAGWSTGYVFLIKANHAAWKVGLNLFPRSSTVFGSIRHLLIQICSGMPLSMRTCTVKCNNQNNQNYQNNQKNHTLLAESVLLKPMVQKMSSMRCTMVLEVWDVRLKSTARVIWNERFAMAMWIHFEFQVHEHFKLFLCFWMKKSGAEETDEVWAHNTIHCKPEHVTVKENVK